MSASQRPHRDQFLLTILSFLDDFTQTSGYQCGIYVIGIHLGVDEHFYRKFWALQLEFIDCFCVKFVARY